ncbi:MAG: hypothetical protein JXX28_11840 [Deltaproteobacteria bacterium]|nr:hypothetical protein [Deltaproteobacteria bacterium]
MSGWSALVLGAVGALLFAGVGPGLGASFAATPEIAAVTASYALVLALAQPLEALQIVWGGALAGTGATRLLFGIDLVGGAVRVGLAWALSGPVGLGIVGVWWGFNGATVVLLVLKGLALRGESWMHAARRLEG